MSTTAAKRLARTHLCLAALWVTVGLGITLRFPDSVLWVAVMSLWANVCGHLAAVDGARAEMKAEQRPEPPASSHEHTSCRTADDDHAD